MRRDCSHRVSIELVYRLPWEGYGGDEQNLPKERHGHGNEANGGETLARRLRSQELIEVAQRGRQARVCRHPHTGTHMPVLGGFTRSRSLEERVWPLLGGNRRCCPSVPLANVDNPGSDTVNRYPASTASEGQCRYLQGQNGTGDDSPNVRRWSCAVARLISSMAPMHILETSRRSAPTTPVANGNQAGLRYRPSRLAAHRKKIRPRSCFKAFTEMQGRAA
ncbi:hypothetical protein FA13DRAFT_504550 [Coprinellus micaceus]|uniref:Uncharacterized protein n=1 Tax=Coprinellus micaceus TaxID=71717 RepID=A0A4Y7T9Z6_COPMI|nr:hypothetical protein FA13DRAFT_504550 [Coprinellus micaceus]